MEKHIGHLEYYIDNVDFIDNIGYWILSDLIIENIIQKHIDKLYNGNTFTILDAGCGNGRWIEKIINKNPGKKLKFIAYDIYKNSLDKAKDKLKGYKNISFILGDLQNIKDISNNSINLCISIYSPLSFVKNPSKVIGEIGKVLKKDGEALIMGATFYNSINSKINPENITINQLKSFSNDKKILGKKNHSFLEFFLKEDFIKFGKENNIDYKGGYGITIYVKPQEEDWEPQNKQKSQISKKLETHPSFFKEIFELEMKDNNKTELINKGNNIIAIFKK